MRKIFFFIFLLYVCNPGYCHKHNNKKVLNEIIEIYLELTEIQFYEGDVVQNFLVQFDKDGNNTIVSITSILYLNELTDNTLALYNYKGKNFYLVGDFDEISSFDDEILKVCNLNRDSINEISKKQLLFQADIDYFIYYPFLTVFNISQHRPINKIEYTTYFPEIDCPVKFRVKRNYYPAGTKFYPWNNKLTKKFKHEIGKKKYKILAS